MSRTSILIIKCDRCGSKIPSDQKRVDLFRANIVRRDNDSEAVVVMFEKEICIDCGQSLLHWWALLEKKK